MGDLREVRRLVAEVVEEAPSPAPAPPLYPLASSVDAASASAAAGSAAAGSAAAELTEARLAARADGATTQHRHVCWAERIMLLFVCDYAILPPKLCSVYA